MNTGSRSGVDFKVYKGGKGFSRALEALKAHRLIKLLKNDLYRFDPHNISLPGKSLLCWLHI